MRVFNRYILILVLTACVINGILSFTGQTDLAVYFSMNTIVYLVITLLHANLNPGVRRSLNGMAIVFMGGFAVLVTIKVIEIISAK